MIELYRGSTRRETPKPQGLWMQGLLVFIRSANPPLQTSELQGTSELLHDQIIDVILSLLTNLFYSQLSLTHKIICFPKWSLRLNINLTQIDSTQVFKLSMYHTQLQNYHKYTQLL